MKSGHEGTTVEMLLSGFHLAHHGLALRTDDAAGRGGRLEPPPRARTSLPERNNQPEQRRIGRLLSKSGLPEGKTLGNLDEALLTAKIRRQLPALMEGGFVSRSTNILAFGLPGRGKTHFLAALALARHALSLKNTWKHVLFVI